VGAGDSNLESIMTAAPSTAPRLRFAPSPTGYFHVGGARTALFNWLVARKTGGTFVLRIEDTDTERNRDEWIDGIKSAMTWVGVDWDEGPYFQSERTHLYSAAVDKLLAEGKAYFCTCTSEEATARTAEAVGNRGYDGFCRDRKLTEGAVRFRTPDEGVTVVIDLIRGEPTFENSLLEDFVIRRTNGGFMFLLANVVDDADMRISHVVRAEEHLPNTPKAVLLWQAVAPDVPLPLFAHLPVIVNEKRQKLSKRRDKVAVEDYRAQGILPEAMRNYLVTLGWMPAGEQEIISVERMIDEFRLEDVNKSSAFFDIAKMTAFNGEYIRALSVSEFIDRCEGFVPDAQRLDPMFAKVVPLIQERVKLLNEVAGSVDFFFAMPAIDEDSWNKTMTTDVAKNMLDGTIAQIDAIDWNHDALKTLVEELGTANGLKLGKAQAPIRVAVTGRTVGPPLFDSLAIMDRSVIAERLRTAREKL
jgi:glutamyl-tRNA synthetase